MARADGSGYDRQISDSILLGEFIHRSANDLAAVGAELHIASRQVAVPAVRKRLEISIARLSALAATQRLLQPPTEATINLGDDLCDLCHHHADARFAELGAFVRVRPCEAVVPAHVGWGALMIVSELLTNTARHAFPTPGGLVDVRLGQSAARWLCVVQDDGVGSAITRAGVGSTVIDALARSTGIQVRRIPVPRGVCVELAIPALCGLPADSVG